MKKNLLIIASLIAGILLIYTPSAFTAAEAEGKSAVETSKEKKGVVPQSPSPNDQKGKQVPKGLESQDQKPATPITMPIYQPPLRGAPGGRVGGGTRGIGNELVTLFALAPDHVGLTSQEQPTLYWFLSNQTKHPIEVTLIVEKVAQPLLEKRIPLPIEPGIHAIRLKDFNLRLLKATQYRWFVALIPDPERRTKDILAGGILERIDLPEAVRMKLSQTDRRNVPHIFAESGIWYDTIMAISELIEANPNDMNLRKQRAALLEQVGLSKVAQFELKQAGLVK
jgi:hypothetical protein